MTESSNPLLPMRSLREPQEEHSLVTQKMEQLTVMVNKMAEMLLVADARFQALESTLRRQVTVSSIQAKSISNVVRRRAMSVCDKNGLSYKAAGRYVRDAIWRDFRAEYTIASPYDLPAMYHENAIAFIDGWTSFALVRKLRAKGGNQ